MTWAFSTNGEEFTAEFESREEAIEEARNCMVEWAYSLDGELFRGGRCASRDEAIEEARAERHTRFWVGECVPPTPPEKRFTADVVEAWIEQYVVGDEEEYGGEWSDLRLLTATDKYEELAEAIQPVIAAWLDRHKLRPTHFNVDRIEEIDLTEDDE